MTTVHLTAEDLDWEIWTVPSFPTHQSAPVTRLIVESEGESDSDQSVHGDDGGRDQEGLMVIEKSVWTGFLEFLTWMYRLFNQT